MWFGVEVVIPNIILLKNRSEIDQAFGAKTEAWLVGWARENTIFILHPDFFTQESSHTNPDYFWKVLKHEYCHLFFIGATGTNLPKWLNEGLACYLAEQVKSAPSPEEALDIVSYFQKNDSRIYSIGYFWVSHLISRFGQEKVQELIKRLHPDMDEQQFAQIFFATFNVEFSKEGLNKFLNTGE